MSENHDEFCKLFDSATPKVDARTIDNAIMAEDAFETLPASENLEKFNHSLKNTKDDLGHGKQLKTQKAGIARLLFYQILRF